jgi:hypothetical protein
MIMRHCDQCGAQAPFPKLGEGASDTWFYGFADRDSLEAKGILYWLQLYAGNAGGEYRNERPSGRTFAHYKRFDLCSGRCVMDFLAERFVGALRERESEAK